MTPSLFTLCLLKWRGGPMTGTPSGQPKIPEEGQAPRELIEMIQWISTVDRPGWDPINRCIDYDQPRQLEWLFIHLQPTLTVEGKDVRRWLIRACYGGSLAIAKWLVEHFQVTNDDVRAYSRYYIPAVWNSNLEMVYWLLSSFQFTTDDIKANNNWLLKTACLSNNRLKIARWLVSNFQFTADEIRAACSNGSVVAQQLIGHLQLITN